MLTALAIGGAILVGALTQRIAGIGFAVVAAPLLMLVIGPVQGAVMANLCGVVVAGSVYVRHVRDVEYRRILPILIAALIAIVPGAFVARSLPVNLLEIIAGVLILAALALSVLARRIPHIDALPGQIGAGLLSGFMNIVAAVGGPALIAYAVASRWEHAKIAITAQFYFVVIASTSLIVRGVPPALSSAEWLATALALVGGLGAGTLISRRVPTRLARAACLAVAVGGAIAVTVRGILDTL